MARPLRIEFAGALYHVTARGDRKEPIYADDADRRRFLDLLGRETVQQHWFVSAYCLMGNHYHLLLETPEPTLVRGMRRLNGAYTQAFNRRHGLAGHVLQGRYQAILVEKESHLLEVARYVVLNPVRANLVPGAAHYAWSSYRATAGSAACPGWLAIERLLERFSDDPVRARTRYAEFISEGVRAPAPWNGLRGQIYLGSEAFVRQAAGFARQPRPAEIPRAQLRPLRPDADAVLDAVARAHRIPRPGALSKDRPEAFRHAVYLLRRRANLALGEVGRLAGISASRVSQIQSAIEAAEPAPALRAVLDALGADAGGCKLKT